MKSVIRSKYHHMLARYFVIVCAISSSILATGQSFTKLPNTNPINQSNLDTRNVMVVDLDNNSQPDIHFSNINGPHEFYLNFDTTLVTLNGNGLSNIIQVTGNVTSGDFNQDGWCDLFFSNGSGGQTAASLSNYLFQNDSVAIFTSMNNAATSRSNTSTCGRFVDFDNDGDLDIYVSNSGSTKSELYRNDGNNIFVAIDTLVISNQNITSAHTSWCDYDNDGDIDLFLPISSGNNKLYRNDDSTFTEITSGDIVHNGGISYTGSWGDYNGDGLMDLFVGNSNNTANFLYKNLGNDAFQRVTSGVIVTDIGKTVSSAWLDIDNDGDLDLFTASGNGQNTSTRRNRLYINNGNETFTKLNTGVLVTDQSNSTGVATADIDRDGDMDLALSTRDGQNEVYFNDYNGSNGFISFNILGTNGKATALDAKVKMKCKFDGTSSKWEYRQVISSKGNSAESSPIIHFGTGTASIVDSLVIEWITGAVCIFINLDINQFYNISPESCNIDFALQTRCKTRVNHLTAAFEDTTIGKVIKHLWKFGDGNTSTLANPIHSYDTPGTYIVEHYTFDSYQKWDSAWSILNICTDSTNVAHADYTNKHISNLSMQFYDQSANGASFLWDFGDGNYSSKRNPLYAFRTAWYYEVCLTATDSCGNSDNHCKIVNLTPFSIDELRLLEDVKVYPNPTQDFINLELPSKEGISAQVALYDLHGRVIYQNNEVTDTTTNIDLSSYSKGIYILSIEINGVNRKLKISKS